MLFSAGIIDILQQYTTTRKVQSAVQGFVIRDQEISIVEPKRFGIRVLFLIVDVAQASDS